MPCLKRKFSENAFLKNKTLWSRQSDIVKIKMWVHKETMASLGSAHFSQQQMGSFIQRPAIAPFSKGENTRTEWLHATVHCTWHCPLCLWDGNPSCWVHHSSCCMKELCWTKSWAEATLLAHRTGWSLNWQAWLRQSPWSVPLLPHHCQEKTRLGTGSWRLPTAWPQPKQVAILPRILGALIPCRKSLQDCLARNLRKKKRLVLMDLSRLRLLTLGSHKLRPWNKTMWKKFCGDRHWSSLLHSL